MIRQRLRACVLYVCLCDTMNIYEHGVDRSTTTTTTALWVSDTAATEHTNNINVCDRLRCARRTIHTDFLYGSRLIHGYCSASLPLRSAEG